MSQEIDVQQKDAAIRRFHNAVAVQHGLPAIGARLLNQHGIEWVVDAHIYAPDLVSLARDGGNFTPNDPRDLLPLIIPTNLSQRLLDFWACVDRCTTRQLYVVDTLPELRPLQTHPHRNWVDALSPSPAIVFYLDAARVHETIFAHEIGHVYVALVEECEDYRMMRDLSDAPRVHQFQHVQSFVLDVKVNEVLRDWGFDLSIIEYHQRTAILSLSRAVVAGYRPPLVREAATIAMLIAATLLETEHGLHGQSSLSPVLCYDGTIESSLCVLRQDLPTVYDLAERLAASVRRHGYTDKASVVAAIDECLEATFSFTGDPLNLQNDLEEVVPPEPEFDKWPELFPGWSLGAKREIGRAAARHKIGVSMTWRTSPGFSGLTRIEFQTPSGEWTPPTLLHYAPRSQHIDDWLAEFQPRPSHPALQHLIPDPLSRVSKSHLPKPHVPRPQIPMPNTTNPLAHIPQIPKPQVPSSQMSEIPIPSGVPEHLRDVLFPHSKRFGRDYMPGVGLWLSQARLSEQLGGEHPYGYANNNPVNYVDPIGSASMRIRGIIPIAIGQNGGATTRPRPTISLRNSGGLSNITSKHHFNASNLHKSHPNKGSESPRISQIDDFPSIGEVYWGYEGKYLCCFAKCATSVDICALKDIPWNKITKSALQIGLQKALLTYLENERKTAFFNLVERPANISPAVLTRLVEDWEFWQKVSSRANTISKAAGAIGTIFTLCKCTYQCYRDVS